MHIRDIREILTKTPDRFYGGSLYDEKEAEAARRVILRRSPFRFYGENCGFEADALEKEAAEYFGVPYAHAVNSGTGALFAALHALGVGPGDEVIVPGYLWISDILAVLSRGALPVLCEIDETLNLDPDDLECRISPRTKCVIAIHMFGAMADMSRITDICEARDVPILEDISQCIGGALGHRRAGSFGTVAVASLQLNKMITSGEGGLVLTHDPEMYLRVTAKSDLGYPRVGGLASQEGSQSYVCCGEGRRYNEICAAVAREQLKKLSPMIGCMRAGAEAIRSRVEPGPWFTWRRLLDEAGDPGSTLAMIFNTVEICKAFWTEAEMLFPLGELRACPLADSGLHVYYNCTLLTRKIPVLPGGFPWNLPENASAPSYTKGSLEKTDDLLDRTVGFAIPPRVDERYVLAFSEGLRAIFNRMKVPAVA